MWPEKFSPRREEEDFLSHLEEFRKRLLFSLLAFVIFSIVCYFFSEKILEFLIHPLTEHQNGGLFFTKPYEAFMARLKAAALFGFILSLPVIFVQGWKFVAPGLYRDEKKNLSLIVAIAMFLFVSGASFAYAIVIPWGLDFLLSFQTNSITPLLGIGPYFSFITGMIIAFGFLFDFPVILVGLVRMGLTTSEKLAKSRKVVIVVIVIMAAVLTPSPDPMSQLLLAGPLWILFEISLGIAKFMEKKRPRGESVG